MTKAFPLPTVTIGLWICGYVGVYALIAAPMQGCTIPGAEKIQSEWKAITADGVITQEEATRFAGALSEAQSSLNWPSTIASIAAALGAAFFGVRRTRSYAEELAEDLHKNVTHGIRDHYSNAERIAKLEAALMIAEAKKNPGD